MKENVVDVLMFIFDNYLTLEEGMFTNEASLTSELEEAGFHAKEISKAFDWLDELASLKENEAANELIQGPRKSLRLYSQEEQLKFSVACRGFLLSLEEMGILDVALRETIIDRAMAIESPKLNLKQFKRIVCLILLNRSHNEEILVWLEDLIYDDKQSVLH